MDVAVLVFVGVLIGGAWSAPTPEVAPPELILQHPIPAPVNYVSRHHAQDELGQVNYGFSQPDQTKNEVRDASGNVAGAYSYVDADNKVVVVEYTAGEGGFQVKSNNLPVGVQDTPEVLAAKLQFVEQYNAAALAAASATNDVTGEATTLSDSGSLNLGIPVHVISSPVRDTPEVIAAKLQFVEAYNAAALAAANAPDDDPAADDSPAGITSNAGIPSNPNPIRDTPEVIAAKLQFVEAYNAAALAAAKAAEDTQVPDDASKVTIVYAIPVMQDTPEVVEAKLKFVEQYKAAALLAAQDTGSEQEALQGESAPVTGDLFESDEPVTDLGMIFATDAVTHLPAADGEDEQPEPTTLLPIPVEDDQNDRKIHVLVPTKVDESPVNDYVQPESVSVSPVYKPPVSGVKVPQAHSYGVPPPEESLHLDRPVVKTSNLPTVQLDSNIQSEAVVAAPVEYVTRYHAQDELGQVNYGFSYSGQTKQETRDSSGNVAGAYTYVDNTDKVIHVEYTAGEDGFQVKSNNLPVAFGDTPEVLAAKLQFVEAYNAAALAAAAAPDDYETGAVAVPKTSTFVVPTPVKDTPEVIAAKLQFVEAYNAIALAAANAPDDPAVESSNTAEFKSAGFTNPNPVRDTPEVIAAKLQFVEAYNAAALAAATAADDPEHDDTSKAIIVHALHPVQDTPEVVAAKLQFVEAYNAAALAAAQVPDDEVYENQHESDAVSEGTVQGPVLTPIVVKAVPELQLIEERPVLVAEGSPSEVQGYSASPSALPSPTEIPVVLQPVQTSIMEIPAVGPAVAVPVTYVSRHHAQDELGQVNYGFSHPGQAKNEVRDAFGNVAGAYTYIDSDDKVIRVEYTAGDGGFQVRSNNLPVATGDTPEVLAAKMQFVEAYNAAALAAAAAPDDKELDGSSLSATANLVVPTPIRDTPEVLAAKLQFVEAYNAAALAAASSPDETVQSPPAEDETSSAVLVSPSPVRDTPEVIAAKLQFVESYNAAALSSAKAADDDALKTTVVYTANAVQDTPEVIAAKLKFVEAYNAAAIAAALAPDDDDVVQSEVQEPVLTQVINDSPILNINDIPESFLQNDGDESSTSVILQEETGDPVTNTQFQTVLGLPATSVGAAPDFSAYGPISRYPLPVIYRYSVPYGSYGFYPNTSPNFDPLQQPESVNEIPYNPYIVPVHLLQQTPNIVQRGPLYAPSFNYLNQ